MFPFVLYFCFFFVFDPNNYFGFQKQYTGFNGVYPIARIREFIRSDKSSLILGDSRSDQFFGDSYLNYDFTNYDNLAFGGASLNESIDLFWFAVQNKKIDKVVFQISFYTLNTNYKNFRIQNSISAALNPLRYYLSYVSNKDFVLSVVDGLKRFNSKPKTVEISKDYDEMLQNYSKSVFDVVKGYQLDYELLDDMKIVSEYCDLNDIELIFITPPIHKYIWENVIYPLNLNTELAEYKIEMSHFALILDMEYESSIISSTDFVDGFHFVGELEEEYIEMFLNKKGGNFIKYGSDH
jgi:hypothetical protein